MASATPPVAPPALAIPIAKGARRLEPNGGLDQAHRLVDLAERIEQDLRDLKVERVGLVKTRKTSGLTYTEAFSRIAIVCAAMSACVSCDVQFEEITTTVIAKQVGVDAKRLEDTPPAHFGFDRLPTYWRAGMAKAFAATTVLLKHHSDP
jgi:hypothetical protein